MSVTTVRLDSAGELAEYRASCWPTASAQAAARAGLYRHRLHRQGRPPGARALRRTGRPASPSDVVVEAKCTGCHGFCERGPIVVVDPGNVFYQGVSPEDVAGNPGQDRAGRRTRGKAPVPGRPAEPARTPEEIPFYQFQQRIVLAHNGVVDPTSIDDYIAAGRIRRAGQGPGRHGRPTA